MTYQNRDARVEIMLEDLVMLRDNLTLENRVESSMSKKIRIRLRAVLQGEHQEDLIMVVDRGRQGLSYDV